MRAEILWVSVFPGRIDNQNWRWLLSTHENNERQLLKKYGVNILNAVTANKAPLVCFRNRGFKLFTEAWYNQKIDVNAEERPRIEQTAAEIIIEEIRSTVYGTKHFSKTLRPIYLKLHTFS